MALVYHAHWESTVPLTPRLALKDQRKMTSVSHARCESTLPLTLSLSASGNLFCPLAHPRRAPNTNFLFSDNQSPVLNLCQRRILFQRTATRQQWIVQGLLSDCEGKVLGLPAAK
jgi:hypothetical protein